MNRQENGGRFKIFVIVCAIFGALGAGAAIPALWATGTGAFKTSIFDNFFGPFAFVVLGVVLIFVVARIALIAAGDR